MNVRDPRDGSRGVPIQTTGLFVIVLVVGLITAGVLFSFGTGLTDRSTVTAGSGECTYTLSFDPRDVDGFAEDRAASERYTDGTFPCLLWLDAGGSSAFESGESVSAWADKSTNEFTATPTGTAPKWETVDGIRAVRFDGGTDGGLVVGSQSDSPEFSVDSGLTVTALVYVVDRTQRGGGLYAVGGDDGHTAIGLQQSDVPPGHQRADQWWATPGPHPEITTEGRWAIVTHAVDADSGELFVDGDSQGRVTDGVGELGGELRIGAAASGQAFDGYVAEYFVSDRRLSAGQLNLVECAMAAKHDLGVDLAAC